jgi:hypothetical protein
MLTALNSEYNMYFVDENSPFTFTVTDIFTLHELHVIVRQRDIE